MHASQISASTIQYNGTIFYRWIILFDQNRVASLTKRTCQLCRHIAIVQIEWIDKKSWWIIIIQTAQLHRRAVERRDRDRTDDRIGPVCRGSTADDRPPNQALPSKTEKWKWNEWLLESVLETVGQNLGSQLKIMIREFINIVFFSNPTTIMIMPIPFFHKLIYLKKEKKTSPISKWK